MQLNVQHRELNLKLVYYGPALSGKTTNLQALHAMVPPQSAGRLMTLETRDDRTLFFDLLPVFVRADNGFKVKVKLYTVPGQVIHETTRRLVLQGADGIVFVADSQVGETEANKEAFANLRQNMVANGLPETLPFVIQFNKRDLQNVRSDAELHAFAARRSTPIFRSVATRGEGVRETLEGLLRQVLADLEARHGVNTHLKMSTEDFLAQLFAGWTPASMLPEGPW